MMYPHLQLFLEDVDPRVWRQAAGLAGMPKSSGAME